MSLTLIKLPAKNSPEFPFRLTVRAENDQGSSSSSSSRLGTTPLVLSIVGFVAAVILFGFIIWMGIDIMRRRSQGKRDSKRGPAFLSIRGLVSQNPHDVGAKDEKRLPDLPFSERATAFTFPKRAVIRRASTREEVLDFHRVSGKFPRAFGPTRNFTTPSNPTASPVSIIFRVPPLSPSPRTSVESANRPVTKLQSSLSAFPLPPSKRLSTHSDESSSSHSQCLTRKVRQVFMPILPDELLLKRLGEQLIVMNSFDDGWCVVGRVKCSPIYHSNSKSHFKFPEEEKDKIPNDVEIGVVPAWCFVKPVHGICSERPVRSSSLGITVEARAGPESKARREIMSWSNF